MIKLRCPNCGHISDPDEGKLVEYDSVWHEYRLDRDGKYVEHGADEVDAVYVRCHECDADLDGPLTDYIITEEELKKYQEVQEKVNEKINDLISSLKNIPSEQRSAWVVKLINKMQEELDEYGIQDLKATINKLIKEESQ